MTSTTGPLGVETTGGGGPGTNRKPGRVDLALAAVTAVGVPVGTVLGGGTLNHEGVVPLTTWLVLLLLVRRRWPLATLLTSLATILAFRTAELTSVGWVWPASASFYLLAAEGRDRPAAEGCDRPAAEIREVRVRAVNRWRDRLLPRGRGLRDGLHWAVAAGSFQLLFAVNWDWTVAGQDGARAFAQVGAEALWLALLVAVAVAYRNRERWRAELAAGLARAEHERRLEADRRSVEERLRIARELHDVVAHTLTVVGVQLRVVDEALEDSPDEARKALRTAQEVRSRAVSDLGSLVRLLRRADDRAGVGDVPAPQADLDGLDDLLDRTRSSGLAVVVDAAGEPTDVPAPVALAAYRVIQEALTNTVRHAGASRVTVRLRYTAEALTVEVVDDGTGPGPAATPGHGLRGMRERVAALGGTFEAGAAEQVVVAQPDGRAKPAGTAESGGYLVRATLPVAEFRP